MDEHLVALEKRMQQLQEALRQALMQHDTAQVHSLGEQLTRTRHAWNVLCGISEVPDTAQPEVQPGVRPEPASAVVEPNQDVPVRDQVHQALALLTVPASPKLLSQVHQAFFSTPLNTARMTTLRRDEERSFRSAPYGRAYYICPALTSDLLTGPRAARPEYLATGAAPGRAAHPARPLPHLSCAARGRRRTPRRRGRDAAARPATAAVLQPQHPRRRPRGPLDLDALRRAAAAELEIHADDDADTRAEAAQRARQQLGDAEQIFGNILRNTARLRRTS